MTVTTISFHESSLPSETYITQLADAGPPYAVHGVALGAGDVTKGASGVKKQWPASELKKSADSLEGTNLVVDHENNADGVVGTVTKAGYKEGTGIVYEAELYDEDLADKIENGLLEVSIRGYHADVDNLEEDNDTGALIVEDITFDNLSIVPQGASPSNTLEMGEHEELSAAELQSFTASLMEDVGPGEWVGWDDGKHGITISEPSDGEIEVDVYSESDGQWRSQGETMMVEIDSLSEWDVEESDIGPVQEDDSEENVAECMSIPMPGDAQLLYPSQELAMKAAEMIGLDGTHPHDFEGEEWYMPGESHEVFVEKMNDMSSEENSPLVTEGMKFFSTVNNSQIVVKDVSGRIALVGTMDNESQWKEEVDNIIRKLADGDWEHAGHVSSDASSDMIDDAEAYSEMINPPEWEEGDMVQWQVNSDMRGRVVHNPDDREYVMVEVFEDGEPSGYTLTAGYSDLEHARERSEEEMADAKFKRGDWVRWDTRNSTEIGKVIGGYTEGDDLPDFRGSRGLSPDEGDILYALRMYDERDGTFHPIKGKAIGHYEESVRSAEEPSNVSESSVELARSNHDEYDVEEEDWVQWYPSDTTEEHGFALDVDDSAGGEDESIVTIEVWTQNQDGEWETDGEEITKPMSLVEPWGNFPREQEEFADAIDGEDPRRAVKPSEEENTMPDTSVSELISDQVKQALKDKAEKHNEEHGDEDGKEITYRMLKNVFNRGMGAYQDSHREGMTPQQWSYARVNAFLYLVRNGNPENDAYTQDNDLLPEDHPKYNETPDEEENERVFQNALTTRDAIVREVFGEHDPMGGDEVESPEEIVERVVTAELSSDEDELDEVYEDWDDAVNMTASSLREWSGHPCSREASLDPVSVIRRNLELLETNKSDWTTSHIDDAKRTISFVSRMKGADTADLDGGPYGCPSKRDISLMNWAFNPFESIPSVPSEAEDELENVDEVELVRGEAEEPVIRSIRDRIRMMRNSPERFSRQQVNRVAERIDGNIYGSQVADLATDDGETRSGEASDVASLAEYEMHEVEFEGSHEDEWNRPNLEDFVEAMDIEEDISEYDDLTRQAQEDVASAFLISASGFPADDYGDLKLPVVEPNGELSVNALAAVKGGRGASEVDGLSEEMESDIIDYVNQLAEEEFNRNWSEENAMSNYYGDNEDEEYMGSVPDSHMFESREDAEEKAEDMGIEGAHMMDDMYVPGDTHEMYAMAKEEMSDSDSVMVALPVQTDTKNIKITNMSNLEEELGDLDSPVAVEADELEALEEKADRLDTMSESIEELRQRTEVMDEVSQSALEELQDADDPMIIESAEYEELEEEASQVKEMYAASLAEEYDAFSAEELSDKYSVATLREKFESVIGEVSEELSASSEQAQPRSQDPSEEELSSQSDGSTEELEESVQERQEEIRQKILSN